MKRKGERGLKDLLIKATRDLEFREEFLKDPVGTGKKHGVSFTRKQLEKIRSTSMFIESLRDFVVFPPPPGYPLYPILVRWTKDEIANILFCDPRICYPIPPILHRKKLRAYY